MPDDDIFTMNWFDSIDICWYCLKGTLLAQDNLDKCPVCLKTEEDHDE